MFLLSPAICCVCTGVSGVMVMVMGGKALAIIPVLSKDKESIEMRSLFPHEASVVEVELYICFIS